MGRWEIKTHPMHHKCTNMGRQLLMETGDDGMGNGVDVMNEDGDDVDEDEEGDVGGNENGDDVNENGDDDGDGDEDGDDGNGESDDEDDEDGEDGSGDECAVDDDRVGEVSGGGDDGCITTTQLSPHTTTYTYIPPTHTSPNTHSSFPTPPLTGGFIPPFPFELPIN